MIEETIETPFGQILSECVDETGSTNTDLLDRIRREGLNGILLRRARNQTQARGTRGRKWDGSGGCLMFSVALPIGKDLRAVSGVTLAIGAAIALALRNQGVPAEVKWPNDILLFNRKLAGILVESAKLPDHQYALVIGVGLNISLKESALDRSKASLSEVSSNYLDEQIHQLMCELATAIVRAVDEVLRNGLKRTVLLWDTIAAYNNQTVEIVQENKQPYEAILIGIDQDGCLLARNGQEIVKLISGMGSIRLKK